MMCGAPALTLVAAARFDRRDGFLINRVVQLDEVARRGKPAAATKVRAGAPRASLFSDAVAAFVPMSETSSETLSKSVAADKVSDKGAFGPSALNRDSRALHPARREQRARSTRPTRWPGFPRGQGRGSCGWERCGGHEIMVPHESA